jgi:hypothetical protein
MIHVSVTAEDIAAGKAGDCYRCPVAIALARVTGDRESHVYGQDWMMWIDVGGRTIQAPYEVEEFVRGFDDRKSPGPFDFELPDLDDPAWRERCCRCEELFAPSELDDEGVCPECRED